MPACLPAFTSAPAYHAPQSSRQCDTGSYISLDRAVEGMGIAKSEHEPEPRESLSSVDLSDNVHRV